MSVRTFISRFAIMTAALLLSFAAVQTAFAAEDGLEAGSAGELVASSESDALGAQATKWTTIKTPEQLRLLYSTKDGFGPGNYQIGADFTLGEKNEGEDIGTCALLSGNYVIDFNGHTVQSSCENLATFTVQGANVTFMDSKVSPDKASVNALGLGCIEVRDGTSISGSKGSATIQSGNYLCSKFTGAGGGAVFCAGGTLTVNGGAFQGSQAAISTSSGTTVINGGTFYGGYPWALLYMGGDTKIVRGTFYGSKNYYGLTSAMGAYTGGQAFDMSSLLASGSAWDNPGQFYYNGASQTSPSSGLFYPYAVTSGSTIIVTGPQTITASNQTKTFGDKAFNLGASTNGDGKLSYSSSNTKVATVNANGDVTIQGAGTTNITINAAGTATSKAASKTITLTVNKAANPFAATASNPSAITFSTAKQTIANPMRASANQGSVTYAKASGDGHFVVETNGTISVAPNTPAGTYAVGVAATAAGNGNYNAKSLTNTVTITVNKAANTFNAKAKKATKTVKRNKKTKLKASSVWKITKNVSKGKVTYKKKSGNSKISVAKNGNITVSKKLKKGKYKVKVKLTAAETNNYKSATKTVAITIRVK